MQQNSYIPLMRDCLEFIRMDSCHCIHGVEEYKCKRCKLIERLLMQFTIPIEYHTCECELKPIMKDSEGNMHYECLKTKKFFFVPPPKEDVEEQI